MNSTFTQLHLRTAARIAAVLTINELPPPQNVLVGEFRYVEDTDQFYYFDGIEWKPLAVGGDGFFDTLTVNELIVNNLAYLNANVVEFGDNIITLNSDVVGTPTESAGLTVNRGNQPDAQVLWNEDTDTWQVGVVGDLRDIPGVAPAFTLSRQGAVEQDTWLLADSVPSNLTGLRIYQDSTLTNVFVDSSNPSTFTVSLYRHNHITYVLLGTVDVVNAYGAQVALSADLAAGQNLAAQISSGTGFNVVIGCILAIK